MKDNKQENSIKKIPLINGKYYSLNQLKKNSWQQIDNNIIRRKGMSKLFLGHKTPFQTLLSKQDPHNISENIMQSLFDMPSLKNPWGSKMFNREDQAIIDTYNDIFKRFFDSIFAKKLLTSHTNKDNGQLKLFIQELTTFFTSLYTKHDHAFLSHWENAKKNIPIPNEDLNKSFRPFRLDLIKLLEENHFQVKHQDLLLSGYDLHYLTHHLSKLSYYKEQHPNGLIEIYNKSFNPEHPLYNPKNRGRTGEFGFAAGLASYNMGIFRASDPAPRDLQKSTITSNETRCPDRLYMDHPRYARENNHNWQNICFSNPYNSCYVNGLSGSILLEIRAILFFIAEVKAAQYSCTHISINTIFQDNFKVIQDYLCFVTGLFVYVEGGHTLSEIWCVFDLEEVQQGIAQVIPSLGTSDLFSLKKLLADTSIQQLIQESFIETQQFYKIWCNKVNVHEELKMKFK